MPNILLQFVQLSDTHFLMPGVRPNYDDVEKELDLYSKQILALPYDGAQAAEAAVREINNLPFHVDFVLHTGDVGNDLTKPEEYAFMRDLFAKIKYPTYYLPGNHDDVGMIQTVLQGRDPAPPFDFEFEQNGVQIVCLDSNGTTPPHSGWLDEGQLEWLEKICMAEDDRPLVIALHHHPIPIEVPWLDELALLNGEAMHKILLKAKHRIRGVFYGHIHHAVDIVRDGILYSAAPSANFQFLGWPGYEMAALDVGGLCGFNVVTITSEATFVRRYMYAVKS
jgi:3',5'-cyclic AMP phosphodiesterase CpdA